MKPDHTYFVRPDLFMDPKETNISAFCPVPISILDSGLITYIIDIYRVNPATF